jgi:DNA-binding PadR family transcriptional regulator
MSWLENRRQRQNKRLLSVMMTNPNKAHYGLDLMGEVKMGTLYATLDRLEKAGWIVGTWEEEEHVFRRNCQKREYTPRRRLYTLTPEGMKEAERLTQQ